MALEIEKLKLEDLVRELSVEAIQYFNGMELSDEWSSHTSARFGKFVRLGEVILLGTTIDYGQKDYMGFRKMVKHVDMMDLGSRFFNPELADRIEATAPIDSHDRYLKGMWPLVDAGHSYIKIDNQGQPIGLDLGGESFDFGRPGDVTRYKTAEIARNVLGPNISVIAVE